MTMRKPRGTSSEVDLQRDGSDRGLMQQFHVDTFVEYVVMATYLLVVFSIIGAPVKVLLHVCGVAIGRVVPAPLIGIVITVIASWYWALPFGATRELAWILLGTGAGVSAVLVVAFRRRFPSPSPRERKDLVRWLVLSLICLAGITGSMVVTDGQLLAQSHLSVLTLGNNDAPSYALISQHLLDESPRQPGNIAEYDAGGRSLGFANGACAVLAAAAGLSRLDVWQVMTAMMLVVLVVGTYALALLLREILGRERATLAGAIALLSMSTIYTVYLVGQWFFAQLIAMGLVVTVTSILYAAARSRIPRDTIAAVGLIGLLLTGGLSIYPHMTILGSAVLLPVAAVAHDSVQSLVRRGIRCAVVLTGGAILALVLGPGMAVDAVELTRQMGKAQAGWSLPSVFPSEMLGFQTGVAAGQGPMTGIVSILLVLALLSGAVVVWRRGRGAVAAPLLVAIGVVLATYFAFYQREGGPTYQQWKWITFFIPLFIASSISIVVLVVDTAVRRRDLWRRGAAIGLGAYGLLVVLFAVGGAGFPLGPTQSFVSVSLDQITLHDNPKLANLPSVHLDTSPYWDTMWVAYFLRDVPVTLDQPNYYSIAPAAGPWHLQRNDQPLAPGAQATPLNGTYRLVRMAG
jgi:hypothetical protein